MIANKPQKKPPMKPKHALPMFALLCWSATAKSADLTWDTSTDPGVQGGPATWDTIAANWTTDDGGSNLAWDNTANAADVAIFTVGNGRVTIPGAISLGGIRVSSTDSATIGGRAAMTYVFEGDGALDFGNQQGTVDTFDSGPLGVQIGNSLTGTSGLAVNAADAPQTGNGWIYLAGDNSGLSGGIHVQKGLIGVASTSALGANAVTLDGNAGLFAPINTAGPGTTAIDGPASLALDNAITILGSDNVLRVWGGRTLSLNGPLSGNGTAFRSDGGILNLNGDNSGFGGTIVNSVATTNVNGAFDGTIETVNGTVNLNQPFPGTLVTFGGTSNVNADFTGTLDHNGGTLAVLDGTFSAPIDYASNGSLVIGADAVIAGNVTADFGATSLNVAGEITGDLFIDDSITSTLAGAVIGGGFKTGFDSLSDITIRQESGPISVGGTLTVIGRLSIEQDGSIPFGQDILTFGELVTDSPDPLDDIQVAGISSFRGGQTIITANSIQAMATPGDVVWTGTTNGEWDTATGNWTLAGDPDVFFNGDSVTFPEGAANPAITIAPATAVGSMAVTSETTNYSFTGGGLAGGGAFTKTGTSTLVFNQTAGNTFAAGFSVNGGTVSINSNQQATGTGPLNVSGATMNNFGANAGFTVAYANEAVAFENATWNFGGTSPGNVTHTYNFTSGDVGSTTATDPASAIQITDSTLNFSSSNTTTKTFNGRINWSGNNTINRTSGNWTHTTNWNRPWYGGGTVTINKTGVATGRTMNFNGAGSAFSGTVILNNTQASGGNNPVFNLNQPLPAATFEVRNRWNLVNNSPGALDTTGEIILTGTASQLTLSQPVNNPALDVALGSARLVVGNAASTVGTLTATNATIQANGDDSALTITDAGGSMFSGTIAMRQGNLLTASAGGIGIGEQTVGPVTQESGTLRLIYNAISTETATIDGTYTSNGGTLRVNVQGVPAVGPPVSALEYTAFAGTEPAVIVDGLGGDSRISATPEFTTTALTLTFSGAPETVVWTGGINGDWDVNNTENWLLDGNPSAFFELDTARFDDTATGTTDVIVNADVNPGSIIVDNQTTDYSLGGLGSISGAATLTKSGDGLLDISLANTFSGGTQLDGGRIALGTDSGLGSGPVVANNGAISTIGTTPVSLTNPIAVQGALTIGDEDDDGSITLTGTLSGAGSLVKSGDGALVLAASANGSFTGELNIQGGSVSSVTNTQATGTGTLVIGPGTGFSAFPLTGTGTATIGNSSITINGGSLTLPGSSSGVTTHTYSFPGGEIGDADATDPATAIQASNATIDLSSTLNTTKTVNARIHWSGDNTINRTSTGFSQFTNWTRAWYGSGTVTINQTGNATGRAMTFTGNGSDFSGALVLNASDPSTGNDPFFNLNAALGASSYEVRNRWNLVNNTTGALDNASSITVADADSRLTLNQPVNNPNLDLVIGNGGIVNLAGNSSTVKTLTVNGNTIAAGTYTESEAFLNGGGELIVLEGVASSSPFDDWAAANGLDGSPGKDAGFDDDPDGDGVPNGLEWILGGNPLDGQSGSLVTTTTTAGGGLTLSFSRNENSIGQATLTVEYNATLTNPWNTATIGATSSGPDANGVTVTIDTTATPDDVTVNIPASNAVGGKLFGRLKATQP